MKILIIGGKGQLGRTLSETAPEYFDLKSFDLPEFDITNWENVETIVEREKPEVIINASAYTAVDRAEEEPDLAYAVNATGPKNLAVAAQKTGSRLIHISTDYVFDGTACKP
ncbi:dTDP-4-dehydrorhamnose reductase subunit, NAD(P)-binding, of dTDP-L-rhamnose synthase (fragment) [Desulfosarcina cetonica]|uniref:SDR family oxidoreductase n=1 Tax=Desulfosarcina cetonica TaxID=90730 RepID=UPI0006CF935C